MRGIVRWVLWILLLFASCLVIVLGPRITNSFKISAPDEVPKQAILEGAAYSSCHPMFRDFIRFDRAIWTTGQCEIRDGQHLIIARSEKPHIQDIRKRDRMGVMIDFPSIYARRFVGHTVRVSLKARCLRCERPVSVVLEGDAIKNAEWQSLSFQGNFSSQSFEYEVPEQPLLDIVDGLKLIIDPYQPDENAQLEISNVLVEMVD